MNERQQPIPRSQPQQDEQQGGPPVRPKVSPHQDVSDPSKEILTPSGDQTQATEE